MFYGGRGVTCPFGCGVCNRLTGYKNRGMRYTMITEILPSPRKNKRFRAVITRDGKRVNVDFGYAGATTYIDGATDKVRENYLKRHIANATEKRLIENLVISPALMSAKLLWGSSRDILRNIASLNQEWGR